MKVILLKDVRGVGQHGSVCDVRDGYALNGLFPRKLAEPATEERIKQIEAQAAEREASRAKEDEALNKKVNMLRGKTVTLAAKATEKGGLFKTISAADISRAVREQHSLEIPEAVIDMPVIKTVGEHEIKLHGKDQEKGLSASLSLVITAA